MPFETTTSLFSNFKRKSRTHKKTHKQLHDNQHIYSFFNISCAANTRNI